MHYSDEQLARVMIGQLEATLVHLRATPDSSYDDLAYCLDRLAFWYRKLHDTTFGQISGCSR